VNPQDAGTGNAQVSASSEGLQRTAPATSCRGSETWCSGAHRQGSVHCCFRSGSGRLLGVADKTWVEVAESPQQDSPVEVPLPFDPPRSWRSKLWGVWSETGRSLQIAWIALWVIGLILLALGVWGDSVSFWGNKPFLTNLVSAATGTAFGIPLALVVLQRITAREADAAEARAAYRMAATVSTQLADYAVRLVKGEIRAENAESRLRAAKAYLKSQSDTVPHDEEHYRKLGRHGKLRGSDFPLQSYIHAVENISAHVSSLWDPTMAELLEEIPVKWSVLNTVVRSRLLETGGTWLTGKEVGELNKVIEKTTKLNLEDWRKKGLSLLSEFRLLLNLDGSNDMIESYVIKRAVDGFDIWSEQILFLVRAVKALIKQSAEVERSLRWHQ
jgi:hypothetical protein